MVIIVQNVNQQAGYKLTEVGVIPEEWNVHTLGDEIDQLEAGISVNSVDEEFHTYGHEQSILKTSAVSNGYFLPHESKKIAPKDLKRAKLNPRVDSIIISRMNTPDLVGECGYVEKDYPNLFLPDRLWMTRFKRESTINVKWLSYLLSYKKYKIKIKSAATGTSNSMKNISKGSLLSIHIPFPSSEEQASIATALSDVDALITSLDYLIAKKHDIKQATMQQLLMGKVRLPGFSGEWKVTKLGDVADKNIQWSISGGPFGSNLKAVDYVSDGVRIIQLQNIGDGIFHDDYRIYTSEEKADELISCNIYPGEIILSKMGDPVARACIVPKGDRRYLMSSDGIRLAINKKHFDTRFAHDYINSVYFRKRAMEASTGSTRQRIGLEDLKKLPFVAPSLPEQQAIATVLSDMDAEIAALEHKREKTHMLKQGMMQELLTGKTRLR